MSFGEELKRERELTVDMTFADFALTEARFRKHFRKAPPDTWNDNMVVLSEVLKLDAEEREGKFPFVWTVDRQQQLGRLMVDAAMVASSEDRLQFWRMLRELAGVQAEQAPEQDVEERVRGEVVGRIAQGLMRLAEGGDGGNSAPIEALAALAEPPGTTPTNGSSTENADTDYMPPWIESDRTSLSLSPWRSKSGRSAVTEK